MLTGGLTSQPIGHYEFCRANPGRMQRSALRDPGPERMTGALWKEIVAVNVGVNAAIKPMNDFDIYGKDEVWAYPERRRRLRGLCARKAPRPDARKACRCRTC